MVIRNPRLVPAAELQAMSGNADRTPEDAERLRAAMEAGQEIPDDVTERATSRTFKLAAHLIIGWKVWDPRVPVRLDDDGYLVETEETRPRLLPPAPATPELAGLLPQEVLLAIMEEVGKVNPRNRTAGQEDGTSRTS